MKNSTKENRRRVATPALGGDPRGNRGPIQNEQAPTPESPLLRRSDAAPAPSTVSGDALSVRADARSQRTGDGLGKTHPSPSTAKVCLVCDDTHHRQSDGQLCGYCPVPCRQCASDDGRGAYCATTPCPCSCGHRRSSPLPSATTPDGFPWGPWTIGDFDARVRLNVTIGVDKAAWGEPDMTERFARYERVTALAQAAPDLLAAAETLLTVALDCQQRWSRGHEERVAHARVAIAKAKGGAA